MKVKYRIDNLELRLQDEGDNNTLHSPWSEIVKWGISNDQEYCWTIATFEYDSDGYPELHYCGDRPTHLTKQELSIFMDLVKEGYGYRRKDGVITKIDFSQEYD
jgi:hypothetical protein